MSRISLNNPMSGTDPTGYASCADGGRNCEIVQINPAKSSKHGIDPDDIESLTFWDNGAITAQTADGVETLSLAEAIAAIMAINNRSSTADGPANANRFRDVRTPLFEARPDIDHAMDTLDALFDVLSDPDIDGSAVTSVINDILEYLSSAERWDRQGAIQTANYLRRVAETMEKIGVGIVETIAFPGAKGGARVAKLTDSSARSAVSAIRLNRQLTAQEIAAGHAFAKHRDSFLQLGITTEHELARHIERILNTPSAVRQLARGRTAYWDDATGTVVIRNPSTADGGTVFRPRDGRAYFDRLQ